MSTTAPEEPSATAAVVADSSSEQVPAAAAKAPAPAPSGEDADADADVEMADSPPLPPKHTPATPGPRAARLQQLFATTLRHTLDKVSRDNFGACFPTVAARAPGTLEFVQRQMVERLRGLCEVFPLPFILYLAIPNDGVMQW